MARRPWGSRDDQLLHQRRDTEGRETGERTPSAGWTPCEAIPFPRRLLWLKYFEGKGIKNGFLTLLSDHESRHRARPWKDLPLPLIVSPSFFAGFALSSLMTLSRDLMSRANLGFLCFHLPRMRVFVYRSWRSLSIFLVCVPQKIMKRIPLLAFF